MEELTITTGITFTDCEGHKCLVLQTEEDNSPKAYTVLVRWHATSWLLETCAQGCARMRFNRKRDALDYFNNHADEFCYNY